MAPLARNPALGRDDRHRRTHAGPGRPAHARAEESSRDVAVAGQPDHAYGTHLHGWSPMTRRCNLLLFGFALGLLLGCRKHVDAKYQPVHRKTFVYQRLNDGEYFIVAPLPGDLQKALREIGCTTKYICRWEESNLTVDVDLTLPGYDVEVRLK